MVTEFHLSVQEVLHSECHNEHQHLKVKPVLNQPISSCAKILGITTRIPVLNPKP